MDVFMVLFIAFVSFLIGVIAAFVTMIYLYLLQSPVAQQPKNGTISDYALPQSLKTQIESNELESDQPKETNESALPISLLLQFLFQELRHSEQIKGWVYRKLSMEFEELLTRTTIGKFFDAIKIEDIDFGNQFPEIKNISLEEIELEPKDYISTVSVCLDLDYKGNFLLSIDGKMKFGRSAYLSIRVKKVSGPVRIQFTRQPYTHWSFGFHGDPAIDLEVESHFQGRQLQSHITNLIVNQIKRTIRRRHTLPNYKIRYKPFFMKTDPGQLDLDENNEFTPPNGLLKMNVIEMTRLDIVGSSFNNDIIQTIYCTFALDVIPWLYYHERDAKSFIVLEITVPKLPKQVQLGATFKQGDNAAVAIETLAHDGALYQAGVKLGDVIVALENRPVTNANQLQKLLARSVLTSHVTLRIERVSRLSNAVAMETDESDAVATVAPPAAPRTPSKLAQSLGNLTFRKRHRSLGDVKTSPLKQLPVNEVESGATEIHKSAEVDLANMMKFNQNFQLSLSNRSAVKYLNLNVWGRHQDKTTLLAYLNIPLGHIATECANSVLGYYRRRYSLLPPPTCQPIRSHPLATHSGFEQVFCYGDILLTFAWSRDCDEVPRKMSMATTIAEQSPSVKPLKKHDFMRTQFNRTTHCDFCSKKIWLKDAVQCQECGLCCHKKCVAKCQTGSECVPNELKDFTNAANETGNKPEIVTSEAVCNGQETFTKTQQPAAVNNHSNSLSIPGLQTHSKSLPPSPQRTPNRKPSIIQTDPFILCPGALEEVHKQPQNAARVIFKLLEQILMCHSDEALMENAKKSGNDLYTSMTQEERTEKVNVMMTELRKALDTVTMEHLDLSKQLAAEESECEKTKLAFLMGQADAKVHALSALMLHYCSSLQRSQEKIV